MSSQALAFHSIFPWTLPAAGGDIGADRFVTFTGEQAGADAHVLGLTRAPVAAGEALTVEVLGYVEMIAPAALAVGTVVYSDANGQPTATGSNNPVGTVVKAAAAPGNIVGLILGR